MSYEQFICTIFVSFYFCTKLANGGTLFGGRLQEIEKQQPTWKPKQNSVFQNRDESEIKRFLGVNLQRKQQAQQMGGRFRNAVRSPTNGHKGRGGYGSGRGRWQNTNRYQHNYWEQGSNRRGFGSQGSNGHWNWGERGSGHGNDQHNGGNGGNHGNGQGNGFNGENGQGRQNNGGNWGGGNGNGNGGRGGDGRGNDIRGGDNRGNGGWDRGNENRGGDNHGDGNGGRDNHGDGNGGRDNHGDGNGGRDNHGNGNGGRDNHGDGNGGRDNHGDGNGGRGGDGRGNNNRGGDNRGNGGWGKGNDNHDGGNDNRGGDNHGGGWNGGRSGGSGGNGRPGRSVDERSDNGNDGSRFLDEEEHDHGRMRRAVLPTNFDWREYSDCQSLDDIRYQQCGDCWAVSSASVMSDRYCLWTHKEKFFAAKQLTTCGYPGEGGCDGGWPKDAMELYKTKGVASGGDPTIKDEDKGCLPYPDELDNKMACPTACDNKTALDLTKAGDYYEITSKNVTEIMQEIYDYGPVVTIFEVFDDFGYMGSGVYKHVSGASQGYHAIRLIGYGTENGVPYWLAANSWGPDWGDKGYFKILRGQNHCDVESWVTCVYPAEAYK